MKLCDGILLLLNVWMGEVLIELMWLFEIELIYVFLIVVNGYVYVMGCGGKMVVFWYGWEFEVVLVNDFGELIDVLFVVVGDCLLIWGVIYFYCLWD